MSQHPEYRIEPYTHAHDTGLAVMWNASDQQWPGGFTKGVRMTAERVADWMDKQVTVLRLVVSAPSGEVVGYGSLWDEPSQPGRSCYVDLLNVHPDYQGRSLCRRMLMQMVDTATEQGYQRMSIGTWSSNLKAVPLYKKVGFFWKPNTTVLMENYIPLLRQLPILRDFFAQTDWYADYDRELQQIEDKQQHAKTGEMEVYICRWRRANSEWIEAVIDRKAQTLTGLETGEFAVYTHVAESKPAQGIRYPITWEVTNKRSTLMRVQLAATGDTHIQIDHTSDFILAPGETRTITSSYRCAGDAPHLEIWQWRPKPTPQIKSLLVLDEEELALGTGLHYEPAANISLHPSPVTLMPGVAQTVLVQVKNHLKQPMQGELQVVRADGLTSSWQRHPFTADAQGYASAALQLTSQQEAEVALAIMATFETEGEPIRTAPQLLPVLVRSLGSVVAIAHHPDPSKTMIYAENDFFFARCEQREGQVWLTNKAGAEYQFGLKEMLGPPYVPNEFDGKEFDVQLKHEAGRVCFTSTIVSTAFAGLRVRRAIIITPSPLVQVRFWLQNEGDRSHTCKLLINMNFPDSFAVNGQAVIPRSERLVTAMANLMPEIEGDFPKYPKDVAEQWAAYVIEGQVHGVVWSKDASEHEWRPWFFDLISAETTIPPQSNVELSPLHLYCGPGEWRTVRRIWQQSNGQSEPDQLDNRKMPVATSPYKVSVTPSPALTLRDEVTLQLHVDNLRKQPIHGRILLSPPAGWRADPAEVVVEDVQDGKTLEATIHLQAIHPSVGAASGELQLQTEAFDSVHPFTILRLGEADKVVQVNQEDPETMPLWQIDNGRMAWTIAPNFHAGIVAWREQGSAINHLRSSYPEEGEFKWMKPWFGGIRPLVSGDEGGWPGKLQQEAFTTSVIESSDAQGLRWRGVRLQAQIAGLPSFKGIRVELDYLTLPGSNLLKAVLRMVNDTPIYRHAWNPSHAFMLFCQVDGVFDNATLYGEQTEVGLVQRKRNPNNLWLRVGNWGAVVNPSTGRALSVTCPSTPNSVMLMDSDKEGGHLLITQAKTLAPQSSNELVLYLALVDSLAQARQYALIKN